MGCSGAERSAPEETNVGRSAQELTATSGYWRFNDCSAATTALQESTGAGIVANRGAGVTCGSRPGGLGAVTFDAEGEEVGIPQHFSFEFRRTFGVAAWINPASVDPSKVHTIFHQNNGSDDVVSFRIGNGRLELVLKVRTPGTTSGFQIISEKVWDRAIPSGWTHVGATWDGQTIRLYMNGVKVRENRWFTTPTEILGEGFTPLKVGTAPIRFGQSRQYLGSIDDVWVTRAATSDADMAELFAKPSCAVEVDEKRELMITDVRVVEDPARTTANGVWTFQHLMEAMAPTPAQAPAMVRALFSTWLANQTVNSQVVPSRAQMDALVLQPWLNGGQTLDLSRAPLRLLAIVNRLDLRNLALGKAGEGRFVFGVLDRNGFPLQFTVILEYRLPATTEAQVLAWANLWHELGALPMGSAAYNAKLAQITERFAGRNAEPARVNGSALSQLRTNEIALNSPWELREFALSPSTRFLAPATVKLTPNSNFMGQPIVANFINQNQAAIIAETHNVPNTFQGVPFLGGSSLNQLNAWTAPGIVSNEARHKFSLNTCNGCHGSAETGTGFLHVFPRFPGGEAFLSSFLTGVTINDPVVPATVRHLDDLLRRSDDMERLLCSAPSGSGAALRATTTTATSSDSSFIAKGIGRVH